MADYDGRIAHTRCSHCGHTIAVARAGITRCPCRRLELHVPGHGGLGPNLTHYPNRTDTDA